MDRQQQQQRHPLSWTEKGETASNKVRCSVGVPFILVPWRCPVRCRAPGSGRIFAAVAVPSVRCSSVAIVLGDCLLRAVGVVVRVVSAGAHR